MCGFSCPHKPVAGGGGGGGGGGGICALVMTMHAKSLKKPQKTNKQNSHKNSLYVKAKQYCFKCLQLVIANLIQVVGDGGGRISPLTMAFPHITYPDRNQSFHLHLPHLLSDVSLQHADDYGAVGGELCQAAV